MTGFICNKLWFLNLHTKFAYICHEKHLLKGVVNKVLLKPNPKKLVK
jgi:hypothetical protein